MRPSEWISVAYFSFFLAASAFAPLTSRKRTKAIGIGSAGILATGALSSLESLLGKPGLDIIRDWVPGVFLLMAYWQSGQYFTGRDAKLQATLRSIDERWFPAVRRITSSLERRHALHAYLEASYLLCYPVVPLGIGVLYLAGLRHTAEGFWRIVLPPSFLCYGFTAFFQTLPPRLLDEEEGVRLPRSNLRSLNFWVLRHAGIRANTLPSAHVATSFAIALSLLEFLPAAGVVFLWIAGSIALATAVLRYHYAIDAALGIGLALLSFVAFG